MIEKGKELSIIRSLDCRDLSHLERNIDRYSRDHFFEIKSILKKFF